MVNHHRLRRPITAVKVAAGKRLNQGFGLIEPGCIDRCEQHADAWSQVTEKCQRIATGMTWTVVYDEANVLSAAIRMQQMPNGGAKVFAVITWQTHQTHVTCLQRQT